MDLGIAGRVALVCASTAGLGRAVAEALAAEGARVVVTGSRAELAHKVSSQLPGAVAIPLDMTQAAAPDELVRRTTAAAGPVDILVLNGPGPPPASAADLDPDLLPAALRMLLGNQQRLVSGVLPGMRARRWGRILAVGSSGIVEPLPDLALSNIGRAALAAYLKSLAGEVAADGVTVNLLLPGRVDTERIRFLDRARADRTGSTPEQVAAASREAIPARRYGTPSEFGAVAAFLCSEPAGYVTGTAVRCDGGMVRHL